MKKLLCIGLISVTLLSFIDCSENKKTPPTEDKKTTTEDSTDTKTSTSKPEDQTEVKSETKSDVDTTAKPNADSTTKPTDETDKTERVFKIITKDENSKVVNDGEVKTVGLGVAENIKKILGTISSKYFDNNDIELETIHTVDNKKIALVNLTGDENYWNQKMQGSLGGEVTEYTLIENVLQRDYKGFWVDGVKFTINGKQVQDTGHCSKLSQTTYK